jgi:hypothetical protein
MRSWSIPPVLSELEELFSPHQINAGVEKLIPVVRGTLDSWVEYEGDDADRLTILRAYLHLARYPVFWPCFVEEGDDLDNLFCQVASFLVDYSFPDEDEDVDAKRNRIYPKDLLLKEKETYELLDPLVNLGKETEFLSTTDLQMLVEMVTFLRSLPVDVNAKKLTTLKRKAKSFEDEWLHGNISPATAQNICVRFEGGCAGTIIDIPITTSSFDSWIETRDFPVRDENENQKKKNARDVIKRYNLCKTNNSRHLRDTQIFQSLKEVGSFAKILYEPLAEAKKAATAFHQEIDPTGMTQFVFHLRSLLLPYFEDEVKTAAQFHPDETLRRRCGEAVQWMYFPDSVSSVTDAKTTTNDSHEVIGKHTFSSEDYHVSSQSLVPKEWPDFDRVRFEDDVLFWLTFKVPGRMTFQLFAPNETLRAAEGPLALPHLPEKTKTWTVVAYCDFACFCFPFRFE